MSMTISNDNILMYGNVITIVSKVTSHCVGIKHVKKRKSEIGLQWWLW